jgi:kumamolisin
MGLRGQGQVIAIMSFDTFLDGDLEAWDRETGTVGGSVERSLVAGAVPLGPGSGEVNLDIQMIRAIAPQATIVDFEAPLGLSYAEVVEAILADGRADIASLSWGHCEAIGDAYPEYREWFEDLVTTEDAVFRRAFDEDLTLFSIPGDEGAYGCVRSTPEEFHDLQAVWYPGSHPLVVSVGGTYEWRFEDGSYHREATWAGPMSGEATGGGASRFFEMPEWQRALGLDARSSMRLSPDVAGPGDPDSGLMVLSTPVVLDADTWVASTACDDGSAPPCRSFGGGTSQSAPFWAGLAALIRQGAEERGLLPVVDGRARLPHLLPLLYRVAATHPDTFNDVAMGSNLLDDATPGWDPATGLGTPNAPVLAEAIWDELRAGSAAG